MITQEQVDRLFNKLDTLTEQIAQLNARLAVLEHVSGDSSPYKLEIRLAKLEDATTRIGSHLDRWLTLAFKVIGTAAAAVVLYKMGIK